MILDAQPVRRAAQARRKKTQSQNPKASGTKPAARARTKPDRELLNLPSVVSDSDVWRDVSPEVSSGGEVSPASSAIPNTPEESFPSVEPLSSENICEPSAGTLESSSDGSRRGLWRSFLGYFKHLRPAQRRLRVCESVSLGEKRFLAIVRVDSESFLLGGSTSNVSMLARLNEPALFSTVLQQKSAEAGSLQ